MLFQHPVKITNSKSKRIHKRLLQHILIWRSRLIVLVKRGPCQNASWVKPFHIYNNMCFNESKGPHPFTKSVHLLSIYQVSSDWELFVAVNGQQFPLGLYKENFMCETLKLSSYNEKARPFQSLAIFNTRTARSQSKPVFTYHFERVVYLQLSVKNDIFLNWKELEKWLV